MTIFSIVVYIIIILLSVNVIYWMIATLMQPPEKEESNWITNPTPRQKEGLAKTIKMFDTMIKCEYCGRKRPQGQNLLNGWRCQGCGNSQDYEIQVP